VIAKHLEKLFEIESWPLAKLKLMLPMLCFLRKHLRRWQPAFWTRTTMHYYTGKPASAH